MANDSIEPLYLPDSREGYEANLAAVAQVWAVHHEEAQRRAVRLVRELMACQFDQGGQIVLRRGGRRDKPVTFLKGA